MQHVEVTVIHVREEIPAHFAVSQIPCKFNKCSSSNDGNIYITESRIHECLDIALNIIEKGEQPLFSYLKGNEFPFEEEDCDHVVKLSITASHSSYNNRLFYHYLVPYGGNMKIKISLINGVEGPELFIQRI